MHKNHIASLSLNNLTPLPVQKFKRQPNYTAGDNHSKYKFFQHSIVSPSAVDDEHFIFGNCFGLGRRSLQGNGGNPPQAVKIASKVSQALTIFPHLNVVDFDK